MEDIKFQRSIFVCVAMFVIGILISSNVLSSNLLQVDDGGYEAVDDISQKDAESLGTNLFNNIIGEVGIVRSHLPLYEDEKSELNQSGFTFILDDSEQTATITGDTRVVDMVLDLVIPSQVTYNGRDYSVTAIGDAAFSESGLRELYIPDSVVHIGDYAFFNTGLDSVIIGNSVETIGYSAFAGNQLTEVSIPISTTSVQNAAFANNQIESIELGIVATIGDYAFAWNQIERVLIPNSVTYIGRSAFVSNQLVGITIGDSVTYIGANAFADNDLDWSVIGDSVTYIGADAFANNEMTLVMFGGTVETIGDSAFADNQLSSIALPDSVVTIGEGAFESNQIENITLGDSLTSIGTAAFQNNELTDVYFSDSPVTIGDAAFANNELTSVRIPKTVDFTSGNSWYDSDVDVEMNLNSAFSGNQLQTIYVDTGDATRLMPLIGVGVLNTTGDETIISEEGSRYEANIALDNDVEIGDDLVFEAASQVRYVFDNEQRLEGLQPGLWSDHSPDVQWYLDEEPLSDETDLVLNLSDIQIADEGEYSVVVDGDRLPVISVSIVGERIIEELTIGDISGEINQDAATITFTIIENNLNDDGSFNGYVTELEALTATIIFADDQDHSVELGDSISINSNNTVRVEGGTVYTIVIEPAAIPTITSLAIDDVLGEIDQEAETITFTIDEYLLNDDMFSGGITELEASSDTIIFSVEGQDDRSLALGESVEFGTNDTVRVEDGIVYTIIIEHPEVLTITGLAIDDIVGEIDEEEETITFTIAEDLLNDDGIFSGEITELEASSDTIIFYADDQEQLLELGDVVSVNTGDLVYVEDGIVYTVVVDLIEAEVDEDEESATEAETEALATEESSTEPTELTEPTEFTEPTEPVEQTTALATTAPPTTVPPTTAPPTTAPPTTAPPTTTPPTTTPPTTAPPPPPAPAGVSNWSASQWRDYGSRYIASTTLPNRRLNANERANWIAEYNRLGGHSAFDREVVRLVNDVRARRGLSVLSIDNSLMMSARFYTQTMSNFNSSLGHNNGPYRVQGASHGASQNIAAAFGVNLRWNGGNAAASGSKHTPQSLVNAWMNSPAHSAYILSPGHRVIGAGFYLGGSGSPWGSYYYLFMN